MDTVICLFGLITLIIGLGLVIKPVARLKVPTRRRAAMVAGIGFLIFIIALPTPDRKVSKAAPLPTSLATAQVLEKPALKESAVAALTVARLDELVRKEATIAELFDRPSGRVTIEIDSADRISLGMRVFLPARVDGMNAKLIGLTVVTEAVKELIAMGHNPRVEWTVVRARVVSRDAPKSVTGATQVAYFGRATYDYNKDRIDWTTEQ